MDKNELLTALQYTNPCQRNWDHSRTIPDEDVRLLLDAAKYAPTKQNETHYKIYWSTDRTKISEIYSRTKFFSVHNSETPVDSKGEIPDEYNITNPQVDANMIIAVCDDWDQENCRALTHWVVDAENINEDPSTHITKNRIMDIGVGIATGQILLTANLLGYRTGCCSAFRENEVLGVENTMCKVIIGIGYPRPNTHRQMHPDVKNSEIIIENYRSGALDENWYFPSNKKHLEIIEI